MQLTVISTSDSSNDEAKRLNAIWSDIGIPPRLAAATLDNYRPENPDQDAAVRKCREFASQGRDKLARGRGLFLQGPIGTGKSHLSVATLRAMVEIDPYYFGRRPSRCRFVDEAVYEGHYCSMISVVEMLDRMRESFREGKVRENLRDDRILEGTRELMHRCRCDTVVILDDIGAHKPTDWVEEQLYSLIDQRYRMQRSTFFTTNCTLEELEVQIGPRSVSRIVEMCEGIRVTGEDWRWNHPSFD